MSTVEIEQLRADTPMRKATVDRTANRINGYVIAQEGEFKSKGRGRFDKPGLKKIAALIAAQPDGIASSFQHPNLSDDGLGSHLGRVKEPWLSTVTVMRDGTPVSLACVRGNLDIDPTALAPPPGGGTPYGKYVMDLTESDPKAISTSMRIEAEQVPLRDAKTGKLIMDDDGNPVAPLWVPMQVLGSDVVATGDAVDSITGQNLSVSGLADNLVRKGTKFLDKAFLGQDREQIKTRLLGFVDRYLDGRFEAADLSDCDEEIGSDAVAVSPAKPGSKFPHLAQVYEKAVAALDGMVIGLNESGWIGLYEYMHAKELHAGLDTAEGESFSPTPGGEFTKAVDDANAPGNKLSLAQAKVAIRERKLKQLEGR